MLSQFDFQCWVNLTLTVEPIWLSMVSQFDSQCWVNLTLTVEPIWLSMLSQFDSHYCVNLLSMLSKFESIILQIPTLPGRILVSPVTQLVRSGQNDSIFSLSDISQLADMTILNWTHRRLNQSIKISALVHR